MRPQFRIEARKWMVMRQDMLRPKVILDWGLGQLSPKKYKQQQQTIFQSSQLMPITSNPRDEQKQQKIKKLQENIKLLTESSQEQERQQLMKILKKYKRKQQEKQTVSNYGQKQFSQPIHNRGYNILQDFQFQRDSNSYSKGRLKETESLKNYEQRTPKKERLDTQTSKRVRYLQNTLLPPAKRDHIGTILDHQLSKNLQPGLEQSRMSRRSVNGNKKNQTTLTFGTGYNQFAPLRQKAKDMNTRLKQMYEYDQMCKKREISQVRMG